MKRITAFIVSLCMSVGLSASCAATNDGATDMANEIVLQIGNQTMTIDGTEQSIDGSGTTPVVINGRTLLPVRAIVEAMGGTVEWDDDTQEVLLTYESNEIKLTIDSNIAYLNECASTLDVSPVIINDRTMLPIRFIAEGFNFDVAWNNDTQTVTITRSNENSNADDNLNLSSRILTVFFSRVGNTDYGNDIDATTSASVTIQDNETIGTTEAMAELIHSAVGGDIARIETMQSYSTDFDDVVDQNHEEISTDTIPELKPMDIDISAYDTVFIGYPVWASTIPQAVRAFMREYDLSGKTVIPFCTHDGYGSGNSYSEIEKECPNSEVLNGLAVPAADIVGKDLTAVNSTVSQWIDNLGLAFDVTTEQTPIKITIGNIILDGYLNDTPEAEQFKAMLPITVSMVGYGGREYYGGISQAISDTTEGKLNFINGDITYCPSNNTVAIFYAQTSRPDLTMRVISMGQVTSDLAIFNTLNNSEDITFSLAE